jgi:ceramide glucosyltransferase
VHPFWLIFLPAIAYQALAILAALQYLRRRRAVSYPKQSTALFQPGVSVLKPLRGLDPAMQDAFVSQVRQNYPQFEILFGVRDPDDPAVAEVQRLQKAFPEIEIRLVVGCSDVPNLKVGVLFQLAAHARYPIWLINDSDIKVGREYLAEVVAPLANPKIGVVTCPYRPKPHSAPAAWEALGISTDFMPSTFVAQLLGVREFGLGSTLAFRATDLEAVGGFQCIANYIADDYHLAKQITGLGKTTLLSTYTVETSLGDQTWKGVWQHQLRWARTIRLSKGGGYAGLPITHAGVWLIIAFLIGAWPVGLLLLCLRELSGQMTARFLLESELPAGLVWLAPAWDIYAFVVWLTSYASNQVRWRDRSLHLDSAGRIQQNSI